MIPVHLSTNFLPVILTLVICRDRCINFHSASWWARPCTDDSCCSAMWNSAHHCAWCKILSDKTNHYLQKYSAWGITRRVMEATRKFRALCIGWGAIIICMYFMVAHHSCQTSTYLGMEMKCPHGWLMTQRASSVSCASSLVRWRQ